MKKFFEQLADHPLLAPLVCPVQAITLRTMEPVNELVSDFLSWYKNDRQSGTGVIRAFISSSSAVFDHGSALYGGLVVGTGLVFSAATVGLLSAAGLPGLLAFGISIPPAIVVGMGIGPLVGLAGVIAANGAWACVTKGIAGLLKGLGRAGMFISNSRQYKNDMQKLQDAVHPPPPVAPEAAKPLIAQMEDMPAEERLKRLRALKDVFNADFQELEKSHQKDAKKPDNRANLVRFPAAQG